MSISKLGRKTQSLCTPGASSVETRVSLAGAFGKERGWIFLGHDGPDFEHGFLLSACFSRIHRCPHVLLNKSSDEAAVAVCLIWQSMRPRDCSGFQTELVILSHVPIIKCCVRRLDYHLKGYHPFSFLGISCCLCYESLLYLSTPVIYYKFLFSQEGSLKSATLPVHFAPKKMSRVKAHISPSTHQRGSFTPKHRNMSNSVLLSYHLGFQCKWDLHRAARLDNPTRHRAGVPHSSILLVFL